MRHRQLQEPEVLAADDADARRRDEMSEEEEEEELDDEVCMIIAQSPSTKTRLSHIKALGMWRIPNPTESGTFSEIRNPTDT